MTLLSVLRKIEGRPGPLLAITAIAAILTPSHVDANGRVFSFQVQIAGPYEITLGTIPPSPSVGNLHLTIAVDDAARDLPIFDVEIAVTMFGPGGTSSENGPLAPEPDPADPRFFDVTTFVDREGTWTINVSLQGALGPASADFPVEVKNPNPLVGIATLIALLAILATLGLSIRASFVRRSKPQVEEDDE